MSAPLFNIVVQGVRDGFNPVPVKAQFAQLFKLADSQVERVFKSAPIPLRRNLDERLADNFVAKLSAIGVAAKKVQAEPQRPTPIHIQDKGETSSDAAAMHQPVDFLYGEHGRRIPLEFKGDGFAYCKLWLVNVLVCVISFGVMYPWASLRSRRYLYQHSSLDRITFDYNANPKKVYWLQLVLVVYLLASGCVVLYSPVYFFASLLFFWILIPLYSFNYNQLTSSTYQYGKLSFYLHHNLVSMYMIILVWPLSVILSLGLLLPYAAFKIQYSRSHKLVMGHYEFSFTGYLKQYLILLPGLLVAQILIFMCMYWRQYLPMYIFSVIVAALAGLLLVYCQLALLHLQWNNISSKLGYFRFSGKSSSYSKLIFKNMVLCLLTAGLYWPWAKINLVRYKVENLAFFANQRFHKWREQTNPIPTPS